MIFSIGFSRSKSPWKIGSFVIRETEKREFSHSYIKYIDPLTNIVLISQASRGQVNITNYDIFLKDNIVVVEYEYEANEEQTKLIMEDIYSHIGKPYSMTQLVLIAIKKILHIEINLRNKEDEFICSEWCAKIAKRLNISIPEELDYLTPSNLEMLVRK